MENKSQKNMMLFTYFYFSTEAKKDKQTIHKIIVNMQIGSKKTNTPLIFYRMRNKSDDSCDIHYANLFVILPLSKVLDKK